MGSDFYHHLVMIRIQLRSTQRDLDVVFELLNMIDIIGSLKRQSIFKCFRSQSQWGGESMISEYPSNSRWPGLVVH